LLLKSNQRFKSDIISLYKEPKSDKQVFSMTESAKYISCINMRGLNQFKIWYNIFTMIILCMIWRSNKLYYWVFKFFWL